jgi:DNA-binding CsgD family transcriptional regulator
MEFGKEYQIEETPLYQQAARQLVRDVVELSAIPPQTERELFQADAEANAAFQFDNTPYDGADIKALSNVEPQLSPRESESLSLVSQGLPQSEAAARLGVRPATLRGYLKAVRFKLQTTSTGEAVAMAKLRGLIETSEDN